MKLEVGMYVRTKKGIRKIIKIDEDNNYYIDKTYINDFRQEIDCISDSCIIGKPSHNIIDLIEVGDYVNGFPVIHKENDILKCGLLVQLKKNDIKSIVTKEQFKSMSYEVSK